MAKKIFNNDIARSMALAADVKEEEAELFIQHTSELIEEILQAEPLQDIARVFTGRSDREREALYRHLHTEKAVQTKDCRFVLRKH